VLVLVVLVVVGCGGTTSNDSCGCAGEHNHLLELGHFYFYNSLVDWAGGGGGSNNQQNSKAGVVLVLKNVIVVSVVF
jgi:hypothetical protein